MSGLRERKKAESRNRMIRAAEGLFAERGLQDPTMEELAAAAEVSVATLYNYFGSKLALQMAVFETETTDLLTRGSAAIAASGEDAEQAVLDLFDAYLTGFLEIDRRLLLDVFRAGFSSDDLLPGLVNLDLLLLQQLGELMTGLAGRGRIAPDHLEDAVMLLYAGLVTVLLLFLTSEGIGPDDARDQVRRLVSTAFRGIRTNES